MVLLGRLHVAHQGMKVMAVGTVLYTYQTAACLHLISNVMTRASTCFVHLCDSPRGCVITLHPIKQHV